MITNSQFKAITADYEKIQNKNRHILLQRKEEIYARIPAYQELEQQISGLCIMQGRKLLSGDKQALDDMKRQLHALSAQKQQLLKEHGYPADYLEPVYDCPDCQDTGYLPDHSKCHCMKQKIAHYLYEQSGLENLLETENFSHLSTDYYQGEDLTRFKKTVQNARKFVSDFSSHYRNLLFYGTVGTGKSFLSCCIAKELLELILGIEIRKVVVQKQKTIEITSDGRGIRLDVYLEDENSTIYDLEMQTTSQKDLPKRTRYYQ